MHHGALAAHQPRFQHIRLSQHLRTDLVDAVTLGVAPPRALHRSASHDADQTWKASWNSSSPQ